MFIQDYITAYKNKNEDDRFSQVMLTLWPFMAILVDIFVNRYQVGKIVNTCSSTGISLVGFVPIQIAYLIVGAWGGFMCSAIISLIMHGIIKIVNYFISKSYEIKHNTKEVINYDYVIENKDSKIVMFKRMIKDKFARCILYFSSNLPGFGLSVGFTLLLAVLSFLFIPTDQCLNTNGKQIAMIGNILGSLIIGVGICFGFAYFSILDKISLVMSDEYPDTLADINFKKSIFIHTNLIRYDSIYKSTMADICKEVANTLNLRYVDSYCIGTKEGKVVINIDSDNIDYIRVGTIKESKRIQINKYASLTLVKSELIKLIVDLYNESKVKV
jgi:hypothetical protein